MRTIDADALVPDFLVPIDANNTPCERYVSMEQIHHAPTIEPEQRKGRWIKPTGMMPPEHPGRHCCSECYEFAPVDWKTHKEELTDYCPHCGLRMKVEG